MTKLLIALFTVLIPFSVLRAQMKIGDNSTTINSNSILELETANKGLVMPRVALTDVTSSSPLSNTLLTGTVVYNTNSAITGGSGTGIYLWTVTNWTLLTTSTSLASNVWALAGNASTSSGTNFVGTQDNAGLSFRTNNIRRMLLDSLGNLAIGSFAFDAVDRERLLVDNTGTNSRTLATLRGSINDYLQINVQNTNSGNNASSDYVATADNGTDSTFYIDMGINSSTYAPSVDNFGGPNDGYLYTYAKHLVIGTQAIGSDLIFLVSGGSIKNNQAMRISGTNGNTIFGRGDNTISPLGNTLRAPNAVTTGTNITGGTLTILGGKSTGTAAGGSVNITGGSTGTGIGGTVNINSSSNNATNINTGTSASDVTIGGSSNNILFPKSNTVGGMFYTAVNTGQIANTASNMTWDNSNNRLGIGTTTPQNILQIVGTNPLNLVGVQAGNGITDSALVITGGVVKKLSPQGNFNIAKNVYNVLLPNISNNSGATVSVTVPNAPYNAAGPNPVVIVNPEIDLPVALIIGWSRVSATNTVTMSFRNTSNSSISSQVVKFDISVIQ
ncbi:MAG: hypothetical protein ABJA79_03205 [Parafilimonas sp.]